LPGAAHVEKRGSFTNTKGAFRSSMQAIQPPGERRGVEFLHRIGFNVTGQNGFRALKACSTRWQKKFRRSWPDVAALGDTGATVQI